MQQYDGGLKLLLQRSGGILLTSLAGAPVTRWLPIELPEVQNRRVDLLGESANGALLHIELQSTNDSDMPLRMAEYFLAIYRRYRRFPRQIVFYVGGNPLRMSKELKADAFSFHYQMVDTQTLNGDELLVSPEISDNVMAVLARLHDKRAAMKTIVEDIVASDGDQREFYLRALLLLAGLRGLEDLVEEEARKVPILNDILENKVLGREYRRGREEGHQEGHQEGLQEGELKLLRRQIEQRFGVLPEWATAALRKLSIPELEQLSDRLFDSESLEELLRL